MAKIMTKNIDAKIIPPAFLVKGARTSGNSLRKVVFPAYPFNLGRFFQTSKCPMHIFFFTGLSFHHAPFLYILGQHNN